MTVRVKEHPKQKATVDFKNPTAEKEYVVSGTWDKSEATLAIAAVAPAYDNYVDSNGVACLLFRNGLDLKELGGGCWEGMVKYEGTAATVELNFNIGTASGKILRSIRTKRRYDCITGDPAVETGGDFGNVPDFMGAIGVDEKGNVEGVDVEVAAVNFTVTKKQKFVAVPATYIKTLMDMLGDRTCINGTAFTIMWMGQNLTFTAETLRFRGFSLKQDSEFSGDFTYSFAYQSGIQGTDEWSNAITYAMGDIVSYNGSNWVSGIAGNTLTPFTFPEFDAGVTYANAGYVAYGSNYYISLHGANVGNRPDVSPADWTDLGPLPWVNTGPDGSQKVGNSANIEKAGWDYLWVRYRSTDAAGTLIKEPVAAIVDQVYPTEDFSKLEL